MQAITTFLMFEGLAEEAMNFYLSLFPRSAVTSIVRYAEDAGPHAGKVVHAVAMSLYVQCETQPEIDEIAAKVGERGQILMPLDAYPFARRYTWLNDRFGVSWQLSLV